MKINSKYTKRSYLALSVAAAVGLNVGVSNFAQAQDDVDALEEIVVTGSRIVRRDFQSNSPITTVNSEDLETQTGMNIESYLNQLPEYNPAAAPTTLANADVQITAVNSVGIASISLRGFGPNRSLVLVDGHRVVPINALMVTDINGVPGALIERVETITGGASAVYGADAVGGVTNFILKDDFEGLEIDAQYGQSEAGDGEESRLSAVLGANFSDGRGNVTMGLERYERKAALQIERDFYTSAWADPYVGGDFFVFGYNGYNTGFGPFPNDATLDAIFQSSANGTGFRAPGPGFVTGYRINSDGSLFPLAGDNLSQFNGTIDGQEYAIQRVYDNTIPTQGVEIDTLKWNNPNEYVSSPQDRYSFFTSGTYDVTDDVSLFARATWARSVTKTRLFPANASFGWEAQIPYNPDTDSPILRTLNYADAATVQAAITDPTNPLYANPGFVPTGATGAQHPVSVELAALLNSRANQGASWIAETFPRNSFDDRSTENTNDQWQIEGGVNFNLPVKDWSGELYFSHGESNTYNNAFGNNSLTRWRTLVTAADYGRNARISGNQNGASPGFGAADITCQTGFYDTLFGGDAAPSQDCKDAVEAKLQSRTHNEQNIYELNLQGGVVDLPAGELRAALGYQRRENSAEFYPDILQSTTSFTDQVVGVYPTAYMDAETSVDDTYVEFLVPIVSDLPGIQRLELELGARWSDYEHTESETTYKYLVNWEVNDWARFRGGFNRATRAPNLGELFLGRQEIFTVGGANFGDPCGLRSNAPYGAGAALPDPVETFPGEPPAQLAPGQTPDGAQSTLLICQAQMGAAAATTYYSGDAGGGAGSAFNWVLQQGNPDLTSEIADTLTLGFVLNSPFESPWLSGATLSFDWYQVDIEDAIQQYSVDYARYLCYGTTQVTNATDAAAQANTRACQNVARTAGTGGAATVLIEYDNQATIETSGFDVAFNWVADFGSLGSDLPGGLTFNLRGTFLDYYKTKQSPTDFDIEIDWKGSLGPNLNGTNPGAYDYRLFSNLGYFQDNWSLNLGWRFLPSVVSAAKASQQAIIDHNSGVAASGSGSFLGYTPSTEVKADSYSVFDLSFNWNINDLITLRGGINNLLDEDPVITGQTRGYPVGTDLTAVCGGAPGCQNPTNFSLGVSGAGMTNGGYYDTIGRRWFMGIKATF